MVAYPSIGARRVVRPHVQPYTDSEGESCTTAGLCWNAPSLVFAFNGLLFSKCRLRFDRSQYRARALTPAQVWPF